MAAPFVRHAACRAGDPSLAPAFPLRQRLARLAWACVYWTVFRWSPRPFHAWRRFLLRVFGAKIGANCRIYASARVWAPWNLRCDAHATVGEAAVIYNPSPVEIGTMAVISQEAFLCGASHDYHDPAFPMISSRIVIESDAWICARATVLLGVVVREGAVLGLGSVASADLEAWTVYAGLPAIARGTRPRRASRIAGRA
jgi:putative colanic acid biosynthesis acetyltransferase WcaF